MVIRHPHTATIDYTPISLNTNTGQMEKGIPVSLEIKCRIAPGSNGYIRGEDGNRIKFTYTIKCNLFDNEIPEGSKIAFFGKRFTILQLHKYQTHIKIWVG